MFQYTIQFKKAALQTAAFFIFSCLALKNVEARTPANNFEAIRTKATNLLLQKQKKPALQTVLDYIKTENNKSNINEATDFLESIAKTFMGKESQEAYEASVNATLENHKEAVRQIELCLQAEPYNSECLVQRIRLAARNKNTGPAEKNLSALKEIAPNTKTDQWVSLALKKSEPDFKNKMIIKRLPDKPNEDIFAFVVLELDRSFAAKNFSRAKDIILYIGKNFADWPDIVFYKQKIELESAEHKIEPSLDVVNLYASKCKNLSKSSTRKYRYDFDLCLRGQL